jgi:alkanesulfonate monooxygenase SsuD/methylene tetrahydromethanopterin reductase-like flavin-dependent oxidoreductase (luciferase family)
MVFATDELAALPRLARSAEETGFDRVWTTEYRGRDAVARALWVALETERIAVATGIAYAFTRVPLAMASLAADVQKLSGGRFALGLGSGTRGVRRWYGGTFDPPATSMIGYVEALREAWAADGGLDAPPPVYAAALNPAMTRAVARSCDGALLHALALSRVHLRDRVLPALREGFGRRRIAGDLEVAIWCVTSVDEDEEAAREMARRQLAFYLSTPSYRTAAADTDWEPVAAAVREAFDASGRKAAWSELSRLIPDAVVDELTISGTPAVAREKAAALEAELRPLGITELVFQTSGAEVSSAALITSCEQIAEVLGADSEVKR